MAELAPSEKRRREARARGLVAVSPLATGAGALTGAVLAFLFGAPAAWARIGELGRRAFSAELPVDGALSEVMSVTARVALPVAIAAFVGALVAGLVQSGGLFTLGAIGRRNQNGREGRVMPWALAAALVMLGVLIARAVAAGLVRASGTDAVSAVMMEAFGRLAPRAILLVCAGGLGDWAWRRLRVERALRMSRADAERERREEEGDPRLRAERRRRHKAVFTDSKS